VTQVSEDIANSVRHCEVKVAGHCEGHCFYLICFYVRPILFNLFCLNLFCFNLLCFNLLCFNLRARLSHTSHGALAIRKQFKFKGETSEPACQERFFRKSIHLADPGKLTCSRTWRAPARHMITWLESFNEKDMPTRPLHASPSIHSCEIIFGETTAEKCAN
jgi:hypothetical protein